MFDYKKYIAELLAPHIGLSTEQIVDLLEIPTDTSHGDFAFPCFSLAKILQKAPMAVAQELWSSIVLDTTIIMKVDVVWPYLNFFVQSAHVAQEVLPSIVQQGLDYGSGAKKGQTVMIESPGPNTNKPLHLWHVRNMLLGNALEEIVRFAGYDVVRVDIVNDRGIHICKSMLAYKLFGNGQDPDKKGDHFVGDWYVMYDKKSKEDPTLEQQAQDMLLAWENGDPETLALWKRMNDWAVTGMQETYKRYGVRIDKAYAESDHYLKGKDVVSMWLKEGIFSTDEKWNTVFVDEEKDIKKVVLRADGTSIYITQDIVLADLRYKDYKMDKMVYVVANEQIDHFKALFAIFQKLGYSFADQCYHLAYGYISLPTGRMKSREGTVIDADDIANDMHRDALTIVQQRYPDLAIDALENRAEAIAMAAIKFFMLKYDVFKDFVFDKDASLSFEGETGPYMQYTHARCCSILEKAAISDIQDKVIDYTHLSTDLDKDILLYLASFPALVADCAEHYTPEGIARYALVLAQKFNTYYQHNHIVGTSEQNARAMLVYAVKTVLARCLHLLGIQALEQM